MNEKIKKSLDKIEPTAETSHRMLDNIRIHAEKTTARSLPYKWAAAIILICVVFSTGVYAFNIINRADTGGRREFVVVDANSPEYLSRMEGGWKSRTVYLSRSPYMPHDFRNVLASPFDLEKITIIKEMLDEVSIYTSDGEPFEFFIVTSDYHPRFRGMHHLELQGSGLYTADGEEVGIIWFDTTMYDEPKRVRVVTIRELNERFSTFEDAVAHIGSFRLPSAGLDNFYPPTFRYNSGFPSVSVDFHQHGIHSSTFDALRFFIETLRDEYEEPWQHLVGDGTITELTIADTQVFRISSSTSSNIIYTWAYGGHSYEMFPPWDFSDRCAENIIADMLRE
ncbi:MAG: hypothetical protein FWF78_09690 [Defluviitaleaceae bacterium]|nr:hypothetical protein [Defluviitaleaceae bacterium]